MSAYLLNPAGEAIGWSAWPWDRLYTPVVGAFVSGRLVGTAPCRLEKPLDAPPPSMRLRARIRRRLLRTVGAPVALVALAAPVALDGPPERVWFRLPLSPEAADRLRRGDPTVRLERLEDGEALARVGASGEAAGAQAAAAPLPRPARPVPVEALLDAPDGPSPAPLDGFAAFLTQPLLHQFQGVFHEYLRRLPEPEARNAFLPALESGAMSILDLRDLVLDSEEFRARRVGYGARLGATMASRAWTALAALPTMGPPRRVLERFRVADLDDLPTAAFAAETCRRMTGAPPDADRLADYATLAETQGRRALAVALSRAAACRGLYLEID